MSERASLQWIRYAAPRSLVAALSAGACESGGGIALVVPGLGDACIPGPEYRPDFSGFSETEVMLDVGNAQCETRLCLIHHFRGRVSCPYGQDWDDAEAWQDATVDWGTRCRIPGTDGSGPEDRVTVPVLPQKHLRRSSVAVYCSCRCANPEGRTDDGQRYCRCPDEFVCQHLIDDLGLGNTELLGSYCIKRGTEYDEAETEGSADCMLDLDYPGGWQAHPYQCGDPIP